MRDRVFGILCCIVPAGCQSSNRTSEVHADRDSLDKQIATGGWIVLADVCNCKETWAFPSPVK